jgi:hypothetical protein
MCTPNRRKYSCCNYGNSILGYPFPVTVQHILDESPALGLSTSLKSDSSDQNGVFGHPLLIAICWSENW